MGRCVHKQQGNVERQTGTGINDTRDPTEEKASEELSAEMGNSRYILGTPMSTFHLKLVYLL